MATLGVLVAGGRGTRLGLGVPKALAPFAGSTLLARALATLRAVCDDVVVCAPAALELPAEGAARADDPANAAGPLAGLVAGLTVRPFTAALALGVDLPLVTPAVLRALHGMLAGHAAVVPDPGGRPQPLAAWYGSAAAPALAASLARGERALVPAVLALPARVVSDDELAVCGAGEHTFLNVNTPADLARAERFARTGAAA